MSTEAPEATVSLETMAVGDVLARYFPAAVAPSLKLGSHIGVTQESETYACMVIGLVQLPLYQLGMVAIGNGQNNNPQALREAVLANANGMDVTKDTPVLIVLLKRVS